MDSNDDCDRDLRDLFDGEHRQLPPEPFLKATGARVAKARARATLVRRAWQAAALAAVAVGSPWLISGSVQLSARLGTLFALATEWLSTRTGTGAAVICLLVLLVWRRRSIL
ncbi:MAG TPA: hypothetical protein VE907_20850 [Gammaproteobacteria bacterium]|nr:hypothetical protein [Gammaproteobacteria bacterium]